MNILLKKIFSDRPHPQVCCYNKNRLEPITFNSQRKAKRFLKKLQLNANTLFGWFKYSNRTGYDQIIFLVEKGDRIQQQGKPVYIYKQSEDGTLLPFTQGDLDQVGIALCLQSCTGAFSDVLLDRSLSEKNKLQLALNQMLKTYTKICVLDSDTYQMIDASKFTTHMIHSIAKRVRHVYYAEALSAISGFLTNQASLKATLNILETFSSYPRQNVFLDANEETFALHLNKHDCFKMRTGKCSLLLSATELNEYDHEDIAPSNESSVHYCRHMLHLMQAKGTPRIRGARNASCGHISLTDGQHRSCISKTMKMPLPADLTTYDCYCSYCLKIRNNDELDYYYLK